MSFTRLMKIKGDYVTKEDIKFNFLSNDISLNKEEFQVLILKLYQDSRNL